MTVETPQTTASPETTARKRSHWGRVLGLALLWVGVVLLVLHYDPVLLRAWQRLVGSPTWATLAANLLTDTFKTPYIAVALLLIWRLDRRLPLSFTWTTVGVMLSQGLVSGVIKDLAGRVRPDSSGGLTVFEGPGGAGNSFPSGHACGVFALASVLSLYYPRWRWLLMAYGVIVALARVQLNRHFFADVIAGGVIGWYWALVMVMALGWLTERLAAYRARRARTDGEAP